MKKLGKLLIAGALSATVLASAGCATAPVNSISLYSNWYIRTGFEDIQPSILDSSASFSAETLSYSVKLEKGASTNPNYSVEYDEESSYNTTFFATTFDWQGEDVLDKYKTDKTEQVYVFSSQQVISGKYVHRDGGEIAFDDLVYTACYFRSVSFNLEPVYSIQQVYSTSPNATAPQTAEEMATRYEYRVETYYDYNLTEATVIYTDLQSQDQEPTETVVNDLDRLDYTLFDNASILTAVRAMNTNDENFAKVISVFTPVEKRVKNYGVQVNAISSLGENDAQIKNALTDAGYCSAETEIKYNEVYFALQENMQGTIKSAWYANVGNASENNCRSTLLKLRTPLSFNLGTLVYELKEIRSVLSA